jgi:20S proteasome alpha/beta subunit
MGDGKQVLLGLVGKDYVLTASDTLTARSIVIMKHKEDKSRSLAKHAHMLYSGEAGDTVQFAEYIQKNSQLYSTRHSVDLSPSALASFVRRELAESLRSRVSFSPYCRLL